MQFNAVALLFSLSALAAAQDLELSDVPSACSQACQDIANLTTTCDQQNEDDTAERNCICNGTNAQSQATSCAACAKANGQNDNNSDIAELMRDCSWDYASVTARASAVVSTITSDGSAILSTATSAAGSAASSITSAAGGAVTSTTSPGAAPVATAGVGGLVAGMMLALPAVM